MINGKKVLVMILARSGSTGVKDKNIADLDGRPVLWYSIDEAKKSKYADAICVSTDSAVYARIAEDAGIAVPFLRAPEVSTKHSTAAASSRWSTLKYEEYSGVTYDYIVDFMCTNPFKTVEDLDGCIEKLDASGADTVVAVARVWDGHPARIKQIVDDEIQDWPGVTEILESLRQDLTPPAYIRCGSVYAMRRHVLIDEGNRRGRVSRPWLMPPERVVNIDEPRDLVTARAMMEMRRQAPGSGPTLGCRVLAISRVADLPRVTQVLSQIGQLELRPELTQPELAATIHDYDAIVVPTHLRFDERTLARPAGSRLKVICTPSVGVDHLDLAAARQNGIEVIALQGRSEPMKAVSSPAELAFALMLNLARRIGPAAQHVRAGGWEPSQFVGTELRGSTVGIVGLGCLGTMFSEFCRPFRMKLVAYDPFKTAHQSDIVQYQHLGRLLQEADFVSIHASLNDSSRHLLGAAQFQQMKRTAVLINTARGAIVDQAALVQALTDGTIAGAALDVVDGEVAGETAAAVADSRQRLLDYARGHDNLLITPHIGGSTRAARETRAVLAAQALYDFMLQQRREEAK